MEFYSSNSSKKIMPRFQNRGLWMAQNSPVRMPIKNTPIAHSTWWHGRNVKSNKTENRSYSIFPAKKHEALSKIGVFEWETTALMWCPVQTLALGR